MPASFTDWNENELYHFGTKGMKWGQRRYQNADGSLTPLGKERYGANGKRSAWGMKHDLNKLDREQANTKARRDMYDGRSKRGTAKVQKKMRKALADNDRKEVRKLRKEQKKIDQKYTKKAEQYNRLLDRSKRMTNKILDSAKSKGYSVHSRDTLREVNRGRNLGLSLLGGFVGGATAGASVGVSEHAHGKHYRVRNDGLGTRTHRSRRYSFY